MFGAAMVSVDNSTKEKSWYLDLEASKHVFAQGAPEAFPTWKMRGVWHVPHVLGASKWGFCFPTCDNFLYAGQFCIYMLEKF